MLFFLQESKVLMDKFMYFSRSADAPPGKGACERLVSSPEKYRELSNIKNWRRMLSNFYPREFFLDGKRWLSVEHFYQGSKFKKNNPQFYAKFSLDSGSEISKDPLLAKKAGGKTGGGIRPSSIKIDPDFFSGKDKVFFRAMMAKFSQHPDLKKTLLATKDASLLHKTRGIPLHRVFPLEKVRKSLKKQFSVDLIDSLTDEYQLGKKLSRPEGEVTKATVLENNKEVFLWILKDESDLWVERMVEVFSEGCPPEILCPLNIVQTNEGETVLVTEYMQGYTLKNLIHYLRRVPISFKSGIMIRLLKVLLRGVQFLHEKGYQHGNLKNGEDIIFNSDDIKINGVMKLVPLDHKLDPTKKDAYRISLIVTAIISGGEIPYPLVFPEEYPKNLIKVLDLGLQKDSQKTPSELLSILES